MPDDQAGFLAPHPANTPAEPDTLEKGVVGDEEHGIHEQTSANQRAAAGAGHQQSSVVDASEDLKTLRSRCYVFALKLATRYQLSECITPASRLGMGFFVDLPKKTVVPVAGENNAFEQLYRQWLWWFLLSLSEETVEPDRIAQAPDSVQLKALILEQRDADALSLVGEPEWQALGHAFLSNPAVPDTVVVDLFSLITTCRQLRERADDSSGDTLWRAE